MNFDIFDDQRRGRAVGEEVGDLIRGQHELIDTPIGAWVVSTTLERKAIQ